MDTLLQRFGSRVMGLIQGMVEQRCDAEDVYQETWTAIWRSPPRVDEERALWSFVRTTAVRKAIDWKRRATSKGMPLSLDSDEAEVVRAPADATPALDLSQLTTEQRTVTILFFWEQLSVREIATTLDVSPNTVKTWLHRARQRLRQSLKRPGNEEESREIEA